MTTDKIKELIKSGEGKTCEFKSTFNAETIETLVAFANSEGGSVLIGVNDKGEKIGVKINNESVQSWINEVKSKTTPSIVHNYHNTDYGFFAEFSYINQKTNIDKVPDKVPDSITDNQQKIIALLTENNRLSLSELAQSVGISKRKMLDNMNVLKEKGFITRVGSPKNGHWQINKQ